MIEEAIDEAFEKGDDKRAGELLSSRSLRPKYLEASYKKFRSKEAKMGYLSRPLGKGDRDSLIDVYKVKAAIFLYPLLGCETNSMK